MSTITVYASALDVSNFLLNNTDFDVNSAPSAGLIENYILQAEGEFETRTGTAFKPVLVTNEVHHIKAHMSAYRETYSGLAWSQPRPIQLSRFPLIPFSATRGHKIEVYDGCLTGETMIQTVNGGMMPIRDVEGQAIYSLGLEDGQTKITKVKKLIPNGIKEIFRLRTKTKEIDATANHPFLCVDYKISTNGKKHGRIFKWKRLEEIKKGDQIVVAREKFSEGIPFQIYYSHPKKKGANNVKPITLPNESTCDLMRFLGFYIGDGAVGKSTLYLWDPKEEIRQKYSKIIFDLFGLECKTIRNYVDSPPLGIYTCSRPLVEFMEYIGILGDSYTKRIPWWVYDLPKDQIQAFIEGYVEADGSKSKKNNMYWSIGSCQEGLIRDTKNLCDAIGWNSGKVRYLYCENALGHHKYSMFIMPEKRKPFYMIAKKINDIELEQLHKNGYDVENVIDIIQRGEDEVYDIEVDDDDHNFIANGFVVHNSHGTVADTTPEGAWTDYIASRTQGRENDWWYDAMQGVLYIRKTYLFRQNKLVRVTYEYGQPITLLNGALTASATTITVDSTYRYPTRGQIRINNEWIHYTGKTTTTLTGCVRGQLGTQAAAHSDDDEVYWLPQDVHRIVVMRAASLFLQNEQFLATVPEGTKVDMGIGKKVDMWNKEWNDTIDRNYSRWYLI